MKRNIAKALIILCAATFVSCSNSKTGYSINGNVSDVEQGTIYLKQYIDKNFMTTDSAEIKDHKFCFEGYVNEPAAYALTTDNTKKRPPIFFLENTEIKVSLDEGNNKINVEGSPLSRRYFENVTKIDNDDYSIDSLIESNPQSPVAAYFLMRNFAWRLNYEQMKEARSKFDKSLDGNLYLNQVDTLIKRLGNLQPGAVAPDFTVNDTEERPFTLNSCRGKYILLDFWASWCPDCRKENPELVNIYKKYKNENILFVGISLDKDKENWLAAIKKDNLEWINLSDLGYWQSEIAQLYAVRWIPQNYLIDKNGIIIGRSLSMQELDAKLSEIFNNGTNKE